MNRARFYGLALATIAAVYFLIFVGGLVRASGAGMGCPDWPRCFGRWVPPTDESQLPADYQEIWGEHGYGEARFNPVKTWTEYVNRLIGVAIGLLVFATFLASLRFWRQDRAITMWSGAALLLVGFEGWLGAVVVQSNLEPWLVTLHMVAALLVVAALLLAMGRSQRPRFAALRVVGSTPIRALFAVAIALSLVQIALGTQVREEVDTLMVAMEGERGRWVAELGPTVLVHRSFSLLVLAVNGALAWRLWRCGERRLEQMGTGLVVLVLLEIAAGAGLFYLGVPAALQPAHLLLAGLIAGVQFLGWMTVHYAAAVSLRGHARPLRNSSTV